MQELLEVFLLDENNSLEDYSTEQSTDQLFLSLSIAVVSGQPTPRTMCMNGFLQGQQISILVDSGSSNTFVSTLLLKICQASLSWLFL